MSAEVIVAIIGLLGILYVAWRDHNSAGDSLVQDAMSMLDRLQARVAELERRDREREKEFAVVRLELSRYRRGVERLITQIRGLGVEPVWTPESDK